MPTVGRNVVHARWLNRFHAHWLIEPIIRKFLIVDVNLRIIPFLRMGLMGLISHIGLMSLMGLIGPIGLIGLIGLMSPISPISPIKSYNFIISSFTHKLHQPLFDLSSPLALVSEAVAATITMTTFWVDVH